MIIESSVKWFPHDASQIKNQLDDLCYITFWIIFAKLHLNRQYGQSVSPFRG